MAQQDRYITQNRPFIRTEIEGEKLVITRRQRTTPYRGKDWPTACIRWRGLHRIQFGEEEFLADESEVSDSGPKLGVSVVVTRHRDVPPTREEIEANRENINRVLRQICGCEVTNWEPLPET